MTDISVSYDTQYMEYRYSGFPLENKTGSFLWKNLGFQLIYVLFLLGGYLFRPIFVIRKKSVFES